MTADFPLRFESSFTTAPSSSFSASMSRIWRQEGGVSELGALPEMGAGGGGGGTDLDDVAYEVGEHLVLLDLLLVVRDLLEHLYKQISISSCLLLLK